MSLNRPPSARGRGRGRWSSPGTDSVNKYPNRPRDGQGREDRQSNDQRVEDRYKDGLREEGRYRDGLRNVDSLEQKSPRGVDVSPNSRVPTSQRGCGQRTRARNKRPDAQIYVPRGRRQQQMYDNQHDDTRDAQPSNSDAEKRPGNIDLHSIDTERRAGNVEVHNRDVDNRTRNIDHGTGDVNCFNRDLEESTGSKNCGTTHRDTNNRGDHIRTETCDDQRNSHNTKFRYDKDLCEEDSKPMEGPATPSPNLPTTKPSSQSRKSRTPNQVYVPPHHRNRLQEVSGLSHQGNCDPRTHHRVQEGETTPQDRGEEFDKSIVSGDSNHRTKVKRVKLSNSKSKLKSENETDRRHDSAEVVSSFHNEQCNLSSDLHPSQIQGLATSEPYVNETDYSESDIHMPGPRESETDYSESGIHMTQSCESDIHDPTPNKSHIHDPGPRKSHIHDPGPSKSDIHDTGPSKSDIQDPVRNELDIHMPGPSESGIHDPGPSELAVCDLARSESDLPGPIESHQHVIGPNELDIHNPGSSEAGVPDQVPSATETKNSVSLDIPSCGDHTSFGSKYDNEGSCHGDQDDLGDCTNDKVQAMDTNPDISTDVSTVNKTSEQEAYLQSKKSGQKLDAENSTMLEKNGEKLTTSSDQRPTAVDDHNDHQQPAPQNVVETNCTDISSSLIEDNQCKEEQKLPDQVATDTNCDHVDKAHSETVLSASHSTDNQIQGAESMDVDKDLGSGDEEKDEEEDSWDKMFDDEGECVDPGAMEELTSAIGKVKIKKPVIDYLAFKPRDPDLSREDMGHVVEIYDFPAEFKTEDLMSAFQQYKSKGFDIKWVDDTHALGVFNSVVAAQSALSLSHPLLKVRAMSEADKQSQQKAKRCVEFLLPYKARPETSVMTARRLVTGALGLAPKVSREQRDLERQKLRQAKEKKKLMKKQKDDIWEGTYTSGNSEPS